MFRTPVNLPAHNYHSQPVEPSPTPPANTGTHPVLPTFAQTQANRVEAIVNKALEKKRIEGVSTELTPGVSADCRTHVNNRLRETAKKLQSKIDAQKMATEVLGDRTSYAHAEATRIFAENGQDPSTNPEVFNQLINHCKGMWDEAVEEKTHHIQQYGNTDEQLRQSFLPNGEYAILASYGERQQYAEAQAKLKIHLSGRNPDTEDPSILREEIAAMAQAWDEMAGNEALRFARQFENTPEYVQQAFISHAIPLVTAAYGDQQTYAEQAAHQKLMMQGMNPAENPEDFDFNIGVYKQLWHQMVTEEAKALRNNCMDNATAEWEQSVRTYAAALPSSPQTVEPGAGTGSKGRAAQLREAYRSEVESSAASTSSGPVSESPDEVDMLIKKTQTSKKSSEKKREYFKRQVEILNNVEDATPISMEDAMKRYDQSTSRMKLRWLPVNQMDRQSPKKVSDYYPPTTS